MTDHERTFTPAQGARGAHAHAAPSPWVARYLSALPQRGTMLDVACGRGRHTRFARSLGFDVTAIDRTLDGVADLQGSPGIELLNADLEAGAAWPLAGRAFDAVVVTNYLWRPIFANIVSAVARNGLLIYETFAAGNERHGSPRNPDFLLAPGELIERTRGALVPIAYEHTSLTEPPRLVARIAAVGPDHVWLNEPPHAQS